jgi:hypothetical protein
VDHHGLTLLERCVVSASGTVDHAKVDSVAFRGYLISIAAAVAFWPVFYVVLLRITFANFL